MVEIVKQHSKLLKMEEVVALVEVVVEELVTSLQGEVVHQDKATQVEIMELQPRELEVVVEEKMVVDQMVQEMKLMELGMLEMVVQAPALEMPM